MTDAAGSSDGPVAHAPRSLDGTGEHGRTPEQIDEDEQPGGVKYETHIGLDGAITLVFLPGQDIPESLVRMMIEMAAENPIGISDCLAADRIEATAQRLADRIVRGGA